MTIADEDEGSNKDLARRMDRQERNHAALAKDVASLAGTVERVALNQQHSDELTKLRFDSLDTGLGTLKDTLDRFMGRINALITGEVRMPQAEQMVNEYLAWRASVDKALDDQAVMNGQVRLLGKLAVLLITSNIASIAVAIFALVEK